MTATPENSIWLIRKYGTKVVALYVRDILKTPTPSTPANVDAKYVFDTVDEAVAYTEGNETTHGVRVEVQE